MAIIGPAVRWAYHYRPMSRGTTNITNITNTYSGARSCGCGGGMSWLGGLFMGLPMMFMGIMSMIPMFRGWRNNGAEQVQQQQQQQPQQTAPDKNLARLKELFPKINWTDDEISGRYTGVTEDGKMYRGTYDQILNQLANPGQIREATTITEDKAAAAIQPEDEAPADEPPAEEAPAEEAPAAKPGEKTWSKIQQTTKDAQAVSDADVETDNKPKEWTDEEKAKPIRLTMKIITRLHVGGKYQAVAVTPDGKAHNIFVYCDAYQTTEQKLAAFNKEMQKTLSDLGWTNVTLENESCNWSSDGSKAEGNVDTPDVISDKTKHHDMTVSFAINTWLNCGSATVTTPDGETYVASTGTSWTEQNARNDLINQLRNDLIKDGWKDFTLNNATDASWVGNNASYRAPELDDQAADATVQLYNTIVKSLKSPEEIQKIMDEADKKKEASGK